MLNEFKVFSNDEWKEAIKKQLKGSSTFEDLIFQTLTGISIPPFLTEETLKKEGIEDYNISLPKLWHICQQIELNDSCLTFIESSLRNHTNSLYFLGKNSSLIPEKKLKNINHFYTQSSLIKAENHKRILNPITPLLETGKWNENKHKDIESLCVDIINPHTFLEVSSVPFTHAGAHELQDITYLFGLLIFYLETLSENGVPLQTIIPKIQLQIAIGSSYLFEVSKLRAVRWLWQLTLSAFDIDSTKHPAYIRTITSTTHFSNRTPENNVLRDCSASMAGVIGGTNEHISQPFDTLFDNNTLLAFETALYEQKILLHECLLDKVSDPTKGSFTIEYLTHHLVKNSWDNIQHLYSETNIIQQLENGSIQAELNKTHKCRMEKLNKQTMTIVGANKYKSESNASLRYKSLSSKEKKDILPLKNINYPQILNT